MTQEWEEGWIEGPDPNEEDHFCEISFPNGMVKGFRVTYDMAVRIERLIKSGSYDLPLKVG